MRTILNLLPFAIASFVISATPQLQEVSQFLEPVFRALAELPLVVGAIWLVLKIQDKQDAQMERILSTFAGRDEKRNESHQKMVDELLETIRELTKRS
jgi:hypothetical protein